VERQLALYPQRWTGIIAFIYILYHVIDMRFMGVHLMGGGYQYAFSKVWYDFQSPWVVAFYVIGIVAASWHFALWRVAVCRQVGIDGRGQSAPQVRIVCLGWQSCW